MHVRVLLVTVDCIIRLARRMPAKESQWIRAIERLCRRVAIQAHAYASDNMQRVAYASDTVQCRYGLRLRLRGGTTEQCPERGRSIAQLRSVASWWRALACACASTERPASPVASPAVLQPGTQSTSVRAHANFRA